MPYFSLSSKEFWRYCVLIIFMDNHFCGFNDIITVSTIQYLNLWSGQCFNKYNLLYMYYKLLNIALQRTWFKDFSDSIRNSINSIRKVTKNNNLKNIDIFFFDPWPLTLWPFMTLVSSIILTGYPTLIQNLP